MFKKEIEYQDFNGQQRKETFYFNLSKAELMEMELSTQAGMEEMIKMLIATKDNAKIVQTFKDLILKSYGIKSEDGTRFIKTPELREAFEQSNAYSELFMEILSNTDAQVAFINGVVNGVNGPEMKEEDEKLLPIYKAWQKWDAIPSGSYMGVYDEAEGKIMHEVHKVMRQIKEEQNNAPRSAD